MIFLVSFFLLLLFLVPQHALAEWTPLIKATDFDGIRADVLTTAAGVVTVLLVIVGLGILIRALNR